MNIIMLLMAVCCSLTVFGATVRNITYEVRQQTVISDVSLEAQELLTFSQAALNYTQGIGNSLSPTTMTAASFQADNLLPASFPSTTPFGQTWEADYVADPGNANILDLIILTSGPFAQNFSTLQRSPLASRAIATQIIQKLEQLQNSNPGGRLIDTGTKTDGIVLGTAYQQNFTTLADISAPDLGAMGINVSAYTPMIFIKAPNQLGYWIFALSDSGYAGITGQDNSLSATTVELQNMVTLLPTITDEGWQSNCPSIGVNLNTITTLNDFSNNNTLYNSYGNIAQTEIMCIPAYKGDVHNVQQSIASNSGAQAFGKSQWYSSEEIFLNQYSIPNYSAPGVPYGPSFGGETYTSIPPNVNPNLYAKGTYYTNYAPIAPDVDFVSGLPLPSLLLAQGFSIKVDGNTYQFANIKSAILTGYGQIDASTGKQIWATGTSPSTLNLNNSQESFSVLWQAKKNSPNPNSLTISIPYRTTQPTAGHGCTAIPGMLSNGGNMIYQCSYSATIPTPQIN